MSFKGHLNFSGKHSATLQLLHEDYSFRYPPLSVARYSFIPLSELWQCGMNEIAKASKRQQEEEESNRYATMPHTVIVIMGIRVIEVQVNKVVLY